MADPTDEQTVPQPDLTTGPLPPGTTEMDDFTSAAWDLDPKLGKFLQAAGETPEERATEKRRGEMVESLLTQAVAARQEESQFARTAAENLQKQAPDIARWAAGMPSQQGIYASTMQLAPLFAAMTALGGKATRLTGLQMLSATTGMVHGLNAGAQQQYENSMKQWQAGFERLMQEQRLQAEYYRLMLDAYAGRADAEEKAALAVERMMGNQRTEQQRRLTTAVQAYRAVQAAGDQAFKHSLAIAQFNERKRRDESYMERNRVLNARAAQAADKLPSWLKARLEADDKEITALEAEERTMVQQVRDAGNNPRLSKDAYNEFADGANRKIEDLYNRKWALMRDKENLLDEFAPLGSTDPRGTVPADSTINQPATGGAPPATTRAAPPATAAPPPPGTPGGNPLEDPAVRAQRQREHQAGPALPIVDAPPGLPTYDPTNPQRRAAKTKAFTADGRPVWMYCDTSGKCRQLTPQEQAKVPVERPAATRPAPGQASMTPFGGV